jgi:hypothetical protein
MKKKLSCMRTGLDLQASIKVVSLSSALAAAISYAVTVLDRIHGKPGKPSQSFLSKAALYPWRNPNFAAFSVIF